jgi:hypothetical protein
VQRDDGCLTALMILAGSVLLLPGICALLKDPSAVLGELIFLAISAGGIALIWFALRRPR